MSREQENVWLVLDIIYNQCLILLEDMVIAMSGKTLSQFGLISPLREQGTIINNHQYLSELAYDTDQLTEEVASNVLKLNIEQKEAYEKILNSVASNCGKSEQCISIAIASSGIAATLIDGGETAHTAFKLPLNMNYSDNTPCNISKQSDIAHVLKKAKLIIWDECTMAHKNAIEALNRTLKDIRSCNQIMGGITVLLAGDFRQTLPVVPGVVEVDDAVHYPIEFLHTLNPPGIPPHIPNLKIGAPIMLLRNLNPPKLCNSTRQVKSLHKNVIKAAILTGKYEGEVVFIPRIPLIPTYHHFEFKRLQYPVRVCYAMTINKAQGQSLRMTGVDLEVIVFLMVNFTWRVQESVHRTT
ncbi:unnamed protein product [Psylliodes chrysocephalus]|uniref:ATP-dependent DNA helicase n=1 Tax=Psylliodes chrysocephalus TaxID=3402493 RepID=A0A9P0D798_9CUCU|nr:unnamed protein product [Psylliodes chrysocephala]